MALLERVVSSDFDELRSDAYLELQLQRRRVYPTDLGYVPREMGFHGHLLEFCGCPFRESMQLFDLVLFFAHIAADLRLFGCLHGLT
jgi:hypothetical protein